MKKSALLLILVFVSILTFAQQKLTKDEQKLIELIDKNYKETLALLEEVININSGSLNKEGVREVGRVFEREFQKIGFQTEWIDLPSEVNRAGHFVATRKGAKGKKLFLIGHLDTVFEKDMPFTPFTYLNDSTATGQGANDMKGGDVLVLASLKALHQLGLLKDRTITVYFNGDEESSGNADISRKDFIERAKLHDIALGYETAQGFSTATVARRGASGWTLKTTGRQSHSSGVFREGVGYGAIYEAARILTEFQETLSGEQYLTFNPGQFIGGSDVSFNEISGTGTALGKTNIVAREAIVTGDLRFLGEAQKEAARAKMREIVAKNLNQTQAEILFTDGIPSMAPTEGNYALAETLNKVSMDMGFGPVKPGDPGSRGAGDISYVADFMDCLDGLGASGTGAHAPGETINMKQFPDLIKRNTILLYRLTR
ncbi:M20/M25/M40 family metallo-hydrolase [Algoriphagus sp.]|jgi:glutamate carboxypeptidase|uniref:M20/M25/M40 family metallo-hydrolase n=1 Tax=Algoriphagus sp. TaxID=1872435 RepID=UPI002722D19C|nr:M20/M25/M40 family metallo-hydrolase [Algoriphagus sp.]MDO8966533.1 M20/M25/M40 family metallo-hydrolase [Algoriphagus sp.]MDP3201979.1 M20/M25/M40 family metallo-hydrolase [Algoriphagus sp.]